MKNNQQYYRKPVRVNNFWNNNFIEYENNGDRNKILLLKEYLDELKPYTRDVINNLKKFDT